MLKEQHVEYVKKGAIAQIWQKNRLSDSEQGCEDAWLPIELMMIFLTVFD